MKSLQVAEDIIPVADFKVQASKYLKRLRDTHRPIVITQNGRPAAVIILPEEFDEYRMRQQFVSAVREGLADAEAGRLVDDDALGSELDAEFGPLSEK